jgi:predicted RecB family nuclease
MSKKITGSLLYDLINCPHRVYLDTFGDEKDRAAPNPFIQLLWEKGTLYEEKVISTLDVPFVNLSSFSGDEKETKTAEAMKAGEKLIYSGRISHCDLLGEPDLLERVGNKYVAIDIKSGTAEYGRDDHASLKKHYAVQLALYTDILEAKNLSVGRYAYIHDINGDRVPYPFSDTIGKRSKTTWWEYYKETLARAERILLEDEHTLPALSSVCKLCHWYKSCKEHCIKEKDLSLISELGRAARDTLYEEFQTVDDLSKINVESYSISHGHRTKFSGIGRVSLEKFHNRARLLVDPNAKPYLTQPLSFPANERELFFDIEVDSMEDFTYMHGFIERSGHDSENEKFIYFWADEVTPEEEKRAFSEAWNYMNNKQPCNIYYYSAYEKTIYKKLASRYPEVCSVEDIESFFSDGHVIDLYNQVVLKGTEWPTYDKSIKTLASYLGFNWRDTDPSGASSVEWFTRWRESGDNKIKQRIIEYNEDDCIATRVLLDGIRNL